MWFNAFRFERGYLYPLYMRNCLICGHLYQLENFAKEVVQWRLFYANLSKIFCLIDRFIQGNDKSTSIRLSFCTFIRIRSILRQKLFFKKTKKQKAWQSGEDTGNALDTPNWYR